MRIDKYMIYEGLMWAGQVWSARGRAYFSERKALDKVRAKVFQAEEAEDTYRTMRAYGEVKDASRRKEAA